MLPPRVAPGIEERCDAPGFGIERRLSGALAQGTGNTRERQIACFGRAANRQRHDVVQMKRAFLAGLGQPALLAPVSRPLDDDPA